MLWEKEKLLIMGNFSFSNSVFKTCTTNMYKQGLVWERVNASAKSRLADMGQNFPLALKLYIMSEDNSISWFSWLFDKMDFVDP